MILGKYTRSISQRRNRIRVFSEPKPTPNRKVIVSLDKKVRKVHSTPSSWKIRFKSCRSHLEGNFDEVDVAEPCLLAETSFLFPAKKRGNNFPSTVLDFFIYIMYFLFYFFYSIPCKFVSKLIISLGGSNWFWSARNIQNPGDMVTLRDHTPSAAHLTVVGCVFFFYVHLFA